MYLCLCNALTDRDVWDAVQAGADRPSQVYEACGCVAQCGSCAKTLRRIINATASPCCAGDDLVAAE